LFWNRFENTRCSSQMLENQIQQLRLETVYRYDNEWGFSNKMLDLTRHIDKVRKA